MMTHWIGKILILPVFCLFCLYSPPALAEAGVTWNTPGPELTWPQTLSAIPGLQHISTWHHHVKVGDGHDSRRFQGAIGLGNGQSFALVGLGPRLNTISNQAGPNYDQGESFFGQMHADLLLGGKTLDFKAEISMQSTLAPIAITQSQTAQGLELWTVDFIPPNLNALLRYIVVKNDGRRTQSPQIEIKRVYDREESFEIQGDAMVQHRKGRSLYTFNQSPYAHNFDEGALRITPGEIAGGDEISLLTTNIYVWDNDQAAAEAIAAEIDDIGVELLLRQTIDHWQAFLSRGAQVQSPSQRFDDLYTGMQLALGVQTDQYGAVSPMNRYTKAWLRDTIGPLRFFSRIGRLEESKAMLDYLYHAHIASQSIKNSAALGVDYQAQSNPQDPKAFWQAAQFMPGRNAAEAPSYLPLQYDFLYRHTGDLSLISARYDYLLACVDRQERSPEGLMPFSGDETFRFTLVLALQALRDPTDLGWSANSNYAWVAAAEVLSNFALDLGKDAEAARLQSEATAMRIATENHYALPDGSHRPILFFQGQRQFDQPFEDVITKPLFFGYLSPESPQAHAMVDAYTNILLAENGTLLSPWGDDALFVENPMYTGMVPGLYLNNLSLVDHPQAEDAFNTLAASASPSGHWQELHWKDHTSGSVIYSPSGRNASEVAARYRPWEGGENMDAAVLYLTGAQLDYPNNHLRLAPHLPEEWPAITWTGLPAGPHAKYDLYYQRNAGGWVVEITLEGGAPLTLDLVLSSKTLPFDTPQLDGISMGEAAYANPHTGIYQVKLEAITLMPGESHQITAPLLEAPAESNPTHQSN